MPGGFFGLLVVLTLFSTPILTRIFGDGSVDEARLLNEDLFEVWARQVDLQLWSLIWSISLPDFIHLFHALPLANM